MSVELYKADVTYVQAEQVRQLGDGIPAAAIGSLLIAVITGGLLTQLNIAAPITVMLWGGLLAATQFIRLFLWAVYRRTPNTFPLKRWHGLMRAGVLLAGCAWGALPLFLLPGDLSRLAIPAFVIAGVTGAALAGLGSDRWSVLLFCVPAILPLIVRLMLERTDVGMMTAALVSLYLGYLALAGRRSERSFRGTLALREQVSQQNAALNQAQQVSQVGSFEWHPLSGELIWSEEHFRLWGLLPNAVVPNFELFRQPIHTDDLIQLDHALKTAMNEKTPFDISYRITWPDGSVHNMHSRGEFIYSDHGEPIKLTGTVQNITAQVAAEQALIAARDEAERANQAKSEFLSSMSHELRTPMNAILGFGQLLEFDDALSVDHKDNVREILKAGHHLLQLINDVLDLAKIESGHIDLSLEPVEVCPVVDECLRLVATMADKRDVQISHNGLTGAVVRADRTRLKQALLNLLSNGIKYNRQGGSVQLHVALAGTDRLRIQITDTGAGIPAARLDELFEPFNRLDAENSGIEGTGIGLTITRRIVELMGGTVAVRSEVGVGSCFWIELPLDSISATAQDEAGIGDSTVLIQPRESKKHLVLYIEDNPANLKLVAQILGRHSNIHLLTAHTPELGIELACSRHPDLILLDINLPGMDGYQVLEVLKADLFVKDIPVLAITANAMPRDIERGKGAGFVEYLTKPLEVAQFDRLVDQLLGANKSSSGD